MSEPGLHKGIIAWMVHSRVAPNLLMVLLIAGGLFVSTRIKQEVFPSFDLDVVNVSVPYPGASPEEVEQGVVLPIEQAVRGVDGVKEMSATAGEGSGTVALELLSDADHGHVHQEIKQAVERIRTFPEDAEDPRVTLAARRRGVLSLLLYGDASETTLHDLAEDVRDRLLQHEGITQVDIVGAREFELHVEVPTDTLRAHDLTLEVVAARIRAASVELPGGSVKTRGGELLLRVSDRRDWARDFATIPIATSASGGVVRLGEVANVRDGFEDVDRYAFYNDKPSIGLDVYRVGEQTPIGVSDAVRDVMAETEEILPDGIDWAVQRDRSTYYRGRLSLLLKNAFLGLCLVLVVLGLFLELRLAFWVTMGIPTSFLGGLLFLMGLDVSINIVSMFAFIIALGIVVDDAIVAGENIYEYRMRGMSFKDAAIKGAKGVSLPIAVSILSNIIAFLPLLFIPGTLGKIWKVIPMVTVTVFIISWAEALFILPAHLAYAKDRSADKPGLLRRVQERCATSLQWVVRRIYRPCLETCLRWRWLTLAIALAPVIMAYGYVSGGHIGMILMPRVESDRAVVSAELPLGTPKDRVELVRRQLTSAGARVAAEHGGEALSEGVFSEVNDNTIEVSMYLTDPEDRPASTTQVTEEWRKQTGPIVGVRSLRFESDRGGPGSGSALTIELSHRDISTLEQASGALAAELDELSNVTDINDGRSTGKEQLDFKLRPEGESLGLTSAEVARQVRNAFHGSIALRQQRQRSEVTVLVRLPEAERNKEYDVEALLIRTPGGKEVPLSEVAEVERGRSYTSITRRDARRVMTVTADVNPIAELGSVKRSLDTAVLPRLAQRYPGLTYGYKGRQAHFKESVEALFSGLLLALIALYFLLGIPFKSYTQPLVIMMAIPFGAVGAIVGHVVMGYSLSLLSLMGVIALAGVVVNDALVLVDYANGRRKEGAGLIEAACDAGARRFRPVLLTTLTTFGGLAPMIFETSRQARFIIPMALSLGFGIVFATAITLILVPTLYVMSEGVAERGRVPDVAEAAPAQ